MKRIMEKRPIFLNLTKIHFPVAAIVSIFHRISGILLSLSIPLLVYLFGLSIKDEQSFATVLSLTASPAGKLAIVFLVWALSHHFFAGLRFLLLDVDVGLRKTTAARSAWLVHIASAAVVLASLGLIL